LYIVIDQNIHVPTIDLRNLFEPPELVLGIPLTPELNMGTRGGVAVVGQVNIPVVVALDGDTVIIS
jgi:hypothetical protein